MSAYTDGLEEAAYNAFCDITRRGVAGGLIFAGLTAETGAGLLAGLATAALSAHLYASYCGRPPDPPPYGTPQDWEGGQCPGISYRVAVSFELILLPKTVNMRIGRIGAVRQVIGPIYEVAVNYTGDYDNDIRLGIQAPGTLIDDSFIKGDNFDAENPQWGFTEVLKLVTREDELPDLCGDPPPLPPPDQFDAPGDVTYVTPEGDTINAPVTFNFNNGFIGVGGNFFIPVNIRFNVDPTLNLNGTLNINTGHFSPTIGPPGAPAGNGNGPGDVVQPPPPGGEPPDPTEPPDNVPTDPPITPPDPEDTEPPLIIRGVVVSSVIEFETDTIIFQTNIPDIYVPNLGYISFLYRVGDDYSWSHDIPIKNARQLVEVPWGYGASDVKGSPKAGVTFTLSPIYDVVGFH